MKSPSPKERLRVSNWIVQRLYNDAVNETANAGWINYMLKDRQKSEFDGFVDCIIIESLHNPIADA